MEFSWLWPVVLGVFSVFVIVTRLEASQRRIERKLNLLLRHFNVDPSPGLSDRVKQIAVDPAQKISAIKAYREETGASLADAKMAIEAYMESH